MQKIKVRQLKDSKDLIKRSALVSDCKNIIKEDVHLIDENTGDEILYITNYFGMEEKQRIVSVLQKIKYSTTKRTAGLSTTSTIFGYMPRNALRKDCCSVADLAYKDPYKHAILCDQAKGLSETFKSNFPHKYELQKDLLAQKVLPSWLLPGGVYTSGIINYNNYLNYHVDNGNFDNAYSAMLVFKKHTEGGYLMLPEYDVGIECADNSLLIFQGGNHIHGVSPILKQLAAGYRFSVVYYPLQGMSHCLPPAQELERIQKVRTSRERNRLNLN
jgi:hypothetical protein